MPSVAPRALHLHPVFPSEQLVPGVTEVTYASVARALVATAKQADPQNLEGSTWLDPGGLDTPCVMTAIELAHHGESSFDGQHCDLWRMWVLVSANDMQEAPERLYDYIDDTGPKSIVVAMEAAGAAWRNASLYGPIGDVQWMGFAHVPSDIQSTGWVSFGGPEYYGAPLLFKVLYGRS